jgi:hypothetical protein
MNDDLEGLRPLTSEEVRAAREFSTQEIRAAVDMYYSIQKSRVGASNRVSAHERQVDFLEDTSLVKSLKAGMMFLENQAKRGLAAYAKAHRLGRWCLSIAGCGHVTAAGLMAHIDLERCCCEPYRHWKGKERDKIPPHKCNGLATPGHLHSYAGLIDTQKQKWGKGERRPYNLRLKRLCYLLGQGFKKCSGTVLDDEGLAAKVKAKLDKKGLEVKSQAAFEALVEEERIKTTKRADKMDRDDHLYVRLYVERKALEVKRDRQGCNEEAAHLRLEAAKRMGWKVSPEQRETWESGHLQAVGLDLRATRYAVRMFLSHYYEVGREILGLPYVQPYPLAYPDKCAGHAHCYLPPCWPCD